MQKAMSFDNIAIVYFNGSAGLIKNVAINIMNGSNLIDKRGVLLKKIYYI